MTYKGHVQDGFVVFDDPVKLDDGTPVSVKVETARKSIAERRLEHYGPLIGILEDEPEDWALNHDRYLRAEHGN